jgi:hypothetical protein
VFPPPPAYRVSRYAVWQFYGVNWRGEFKPLVLDTPEGGYYLYHHIPYPFVPTHTYEYMPYARE